MKATTENTQILGKTSKEVTTANIPPENKDSKNKIKLLAFLFSILYLAEGINSSLINSPKVYQAFIELGFPYYLGLFYIIIYHILMLVKIIFFEYYLLMLFSCLISVVVKEGLSLKELKDFALNIIKDNE